MCGSEVDRFELSGAATLQAWTVIRIAPRDFTAPYVVGYARLREGPRVLVRVNADPEQLAPDIGLVVSGARLGAARGRRSVGLEAAPVEGLGA